MLGTILMAAALLAASAPTAAQGGACPAEQPLARANVLALATSPEHAAARARYAVPAAAAADVRLLAGSADAAACAALHAWLDAHTGSPPERWHRSFYRVGGLYYVALTRVSTPPATLPAGHVWVSMGHHPTYVLDLGFHRVAGVAM